ncbi:MAG: recombinase zinc beta ribbon domain-containing protein, partial [Candidatus Nanopelagicales bacterium]|nr:recombinase zinc beta ribbon domain-containing protein [Candidatus Nanopelagicales bacterium]
LILDAVKAVMDGSSISAAAVTMNEAGATSKRGNPWNGSTLRRLLMNPTLAGLRHYEGEIQLNEQGKVFHDSDTEIIPLVTWRELQKVIGSRDVTRKVGTSGEQLMLAGIALCGSCNALMSRDTYKTKEGRASQYRCSSKTRFTCPLPVTVVAARLDAFVIEQLQPLGHLPVTKLVSEEEPATVIQRETLSLQIESIASEFATAAPDQISELANTLWGFKQQLLALPSKLVEHYEKAGETFAEVLTHSPALCGTTGD